MKNFYVTTPIFYPSGKPHLGHAFSTIYASLLSEYKKMIGYNTFFLTGTDEHGQKIQETAKKNNLNTIEFIDKNVNVFIKLWEKLGIKYNQFIRTTYNFHKETVKKIFDILYEKKYIYLGNWKGLYCVSCEENYLKSNAIDKGGKLSCIHGHELIEKNEETFFLKVSLFNDWIIDYLRNNKDFIFPENRATELINNFLIDNKLEDLSITRTTFDWGIKVNNHENHVIYVWLDALTNYITSLGYLQENNSNFSNFWQNSNSEKIHLIGKEITRFHCIYWPIILKMLDLPLPTKIISHGWIITETGKMSKSLGNVIDPIEIIDKYGRDIFRYFLIKEISLKNDSVFSIKKLEEIYNVDFANNYGNLISRTIGMLTKYNNKVIPNYNGPITKLDKNIVDKAIKLIDAFKNDINELNLSNLINHIFEFENDLNLYVEQSKPWELKKEGKTKELNSFLSILSNGIKIIISLLSPILIDATPIAKEQMNFTNKIISLENLTNFNLIDNLVVGESKPIFVRIDINK